MSQNEFQFSEETFSIHEMLEDLQEVAVYAKQIELECVVTKPSETVPLPLLFVVVESEEEEDMESFVLVYTFLPVEEEGVNHAKLLQTYLDIPVDINGIDHVAMLEFLNYFNTKSTGANVVVVPHESGEGVKLAVRAVQAYQLDQSIDPVIFANQLQLFVVFSGTVEFVASLMADGIGFDQAVAQLGI